MFEHHYSSDEVIVFELKFDILYIVEKADTKIECQRIY